jgi:hypothetical protein
VKLEGAEYTDLHMKVPILELDYTVSAIDIGISHRSMDSLAPKSGHLTANRYKKESVICI